MEDVWEFKEGTTCLIAKDSEIDSDNSELAVDIISKSLYDIRCLHDFEWSLMLENSGLESFIQVL